MRVLPESRGMRAVGGGGLTDRRRVAAVALSPSAVPASPVTIASVPTEVETLILLLDGPAPKPHEKLACPRSWAHVICTVCAGATELRAAMANDEAATTNAGRRPRVLRLSVMATCERVIAASSLAGSPYRRGG